MGSFLSTPAFEVRRKRLLPLFRANHSHFSPLDSKGLANPVPWLLAGLLYGPCDPQAFFQLYDTMSPHLPPQSHKGLHTNELTRESCQNALGNPDLVDEFVLFFEDRLVQDALFNTSELVKRELKEMPMLLDGLCADGGAALACIAVGLELEVQECVVDGLAMAAATPRKPPPSISESVSVSGDVSGTNPVSSSEQEQEEQQQQQKNPIQTALESLQSRDDPYRIHKLEELPGLLLAFAERDMKHYFVPYMASRAIPRLKRLVNDDFALDAAVLLLIQCSRVPESMQFDSVDDWVSKAGLP
ncbi:fungal protein [Schizosaccharomyces japonicus yFS275]|uniref:Fungal protein n=1 Tax=Schizosaccharomyces japonicus (strain yFS275 / FY16936) TaxID=402676 RepID=B6JWQ5_SCHJY|nr:fungal protein [Schizosaccharomyces japonicus yFS275]EEB05806.1 fungal protein [Schizosaccharomyces japonicus yFS275]